LQSNPITGYGIHVHARLMSITGRRSTLMAAVLAGSN